MSCGTQKVLSFGANDPITKRFQAVELRRLVGARKLCKMGWKVVIS